MKYLIEIGNRYAEKSSWVDFALTKFCLCAIGVIIGIHVPSSGKTIALIIAFAVLIPTYVLLMSKVFKVIKEMRKKED